MKNLRRGSTLLLVLVLAAISGVVLMTFFFTWGQERNRTGKLIQRTRAQALARRVVMRIAALVQEKPWSERFFKPDRAAFDSAGGSEGRFGEDFAEIKSGSATYTGTVQQLSSQSKQFRMKLRLKYSSGSVSAPDYAHVSTWDMQWSEGILGNLNRAHVLGAVETDDASVSEDQLDEQLDLIRDTARDPKRDKDVAGTPAEPWIGEVRDWEKAKDPTLASAGGDPLSGLDIPPYVDGTKPPGTADPLDEARKAVTAAATAAAGSPGQQVADAGQGPYLDLPDGTPTVDGSALPTLPDRAMVRFGSGKVFIRVSNLSDSSMDAESLAPSSCPRGCPKCPALAYVNDLPSVPALKGSGRIVYTCGWGSCFAPACKCPACP